MMNETIMVRKLNCLFVSLSIVLLGSCGQNALDNKIWKHGCRDHHTMSINVAGATIMNPNIMTPDGDGINDQYGLLFFYSSTDTLNITNYEIEIMHNDHGVVYSQTIATAQIYSGFYGLNRWDGYISGQGSPVEGCYDVSFSGEVNGQVFSGTGTFVLITQLSSFKCDGYGCYTSDGIPPNSDVLIGGCMDDNLRNP